MNIITYFISTAERRQYTQFFKFKSTEVNLLSCPICLSGKMMDSALLLARSPVNQALCEWSILLTINFFRTHKHLFIHTAYVNRF